MNDSGNNKRFVLLDRDGVINRERGDYTMNRAEWEWAPGALKGLKLLTSQGFKIIVITNQSCISKGLLSEKGLDELHSFMVEEVRKAGGDIKAVYYCPHTRAHGCSCRKPLPGMILTAAEDYGIELGRTFLAGDSPRDIEAGLNAGTRTVSIGENPLFSGEEASFEDLEIASKYIIEETEKLENS